MASDQISSLGAWVDELLNTVFFQPDNDLSSRAIHEKFSSDLKVRINGVPISFEEYEKAIAATRAQNHLSIQCNRELLSTRDSDVDAAEGSVAHLANFTLKDKHNGQERAETTVTLATVKTVDGRRVLSELTEVHRSA
ncbi:hypothetical protein BDV34DRAFT_218976 [Aspergillus parasiticus]|uniref:SnoaL-like domain-containing protein n=1 Tax=Aspergillus parasiticus TaxID=5067 RepID=A0A5N6E2L4_ASPPA|nr:hypothetical protein BDV34DRAFT_218976 [Aspergillus parasiticus]